MINRRTLIGAGATTAAATLVSAARPAAAQAAPPVTVHNVFDYGYTSGADLAPALNAATAAAGNDGIVYIPAGDYYSTGSHQFAPEGTYRHIDVRGDGRELTRIRLVGTSARFRWGGTRAGTPPTFGAMGGWSGDFKLTADTTSRPSCLMELGAQSSRGYRDISLVGAQKGLVLNSTQNARLDHIRVDNCDFGIIFDYGAGGNTITHPELEGNGINVRFAARPSAPEGPKKSPSDNRFVMGLIEAQTGNTTVHVDHLSGQNNEFVGTQFGAHLTDTIIRCTHNNVADYHTDPVIRERTASHNLRFTGCYFVGGAKAIHHIAKQSTISITDCHFRSMPVAFELGQDARVNIDRWDAVSVDFRYRAYMWSGNEHAQIRHPLGIVDYRFGARTATNIAVLDIAGNVIGHVPLNP